MMKNGVVSEVKKFTQLKVQKNKTANKAIGISEVRDYIDKKIEINDVIEKITNIEIQKYLKEAIN